MMGVKEFPMSGTVQLVVPRCECNKQMVTQSGMMGLDLIFSCRENHIILIPLLSDLRKINKYPSENLSFVDERGNFLEM